MSRLKVNISNSLVKTKIRIQIVVLETQLTSEQTTPDQDRPHQTNTVPHERDLLCGKGQRGQKRRQEKRERRTSKGQEGSASYLASDRTAHRLVGGEPGGRWEYMMIAMATDTWAPVPYG